MTRLSFRPRRVGATVLNGGSTDWSEAGGVEAMLAGVLLILGGESLMLKETR
jgi:hypothetical protein